jgi:hypothetical protein
MGDVGSVRDLWEVLDGTGAHQSRLAMVADLGGRR